jgi:hypothetical protein
MFPLEIPLFSRQRGKSYIQPRTYYKRTKPCRDVGQKEVRFKVTDKKMEIYRDIALYLYENNLMEKPNIHSFGRWCMEHVSNEYRQSVIESKIMKQQEQRQKQLQQPFPLSYTPYYSSEQEQLF